VGTLSALGADASSSLPGAGVAAQPFEMLHPDASWCGPRVLYFFSVYLGKERPLNEVVALCKTDEQGLTSLADLSHAAEKLGLKPTPVRCTADDLAEFNGPALISLAAADAGPVHFVGLLGKEGERLVVMDPSLSVHTRRVPMDRLAKSFTGHAILLGEAGAARSRWLSWPAMLALTAGWLAVLVGAARPGALARLAFWRRPIAHEGKDAN